MPGYIRIDRKILEWEWYSDVNTCRLFIHLILKANWKDGKFKGVDIPRGSLATSYENLSLETGISVRSVRTALNHLKTTGEVAVNRHPKFSVITIKNYEMYQTSDMIAESQVTANRQSSDSQSTTIEEKKEGNKEKNKNIMCEADALFEKLWSLYPVKRGKGQVSDSQKKKLLAIGEPVLLKAIDRYRSELEKESSWKRAQNGSTFFNTGYVDYLDENFVPQRMPAGKGKNRFNNFPQRDYDFAELEEELLDY